MLAAPPGAHHVAQRRVGPRTLRSSASGRVELLDADKGHVAMRMALLAGDEIHVDLALHSTRRSTRPTPTRRSSSMTGGSAPRPARGAERHGCGAGSWRHDEERQGSTQAAAPGAGAGGSTGPPWCSCQPQVGVGRALEDALGPCAGVFGSLALVAVGQQEHERRRLAPLGARGGHELVEHDLRAVDEIPYWASHTTGGRVPARCSRLDPRRQLAERAVCTSKAALARGIAAGRVVPPGLGVVEHGVAVTERAALDVLAREPDRHAVFEQGREGELLSRGPVDRALVGLAKAARRRSRPRSSLRWVTKPAGRSSSASLSARSRSSATPVVSAGLRRAPPPRPSFDESRRGAVTPACPRGSSGASEPVLRARRRSGHAPEAPPPALAHGRVLRHTL